MTEKMLLDLRNQVLEKYREAAKHYAAARELDKYVERVIRDTKAV